jgi:hypothetical protein
MAFDTEFAIWPLPKRFHLHAGQIGMIERIVERDLPPMRGTSINLAQFGDTLCKRILPV